MTDLSQLTPLVEENLRSTGWFRPETALTVGAIGLFVIDLFWKKHPRRVAFLTIGALVALAAAAAFLAVQPSSAEGLFNGMLASDAKKARPMIAVYSGSSAARPPNFSISRWWARS